MQSEKQQTADVSVIIPAYRARASIGRALTSVIRQTLKPRQVIVVDDGSGDGTFEAAEAMRAQMNGISFVVVAQDNRGAGAARNRALQEATGKYVAFLDADDEWQTEKIMRSMAVIGGTEQVLVAHDYSRIEPDGSEQTVECARRFSQAHDPFVGLFRQGFIATSTVVARRDAVLAAGGFDKNLATAQDFDLWLKMLAVPDTSFTIFPEILTRYHVTGGSITSFTARRLACSLLIARRHAPSLIDLWFRIVAVHYETLTAYRSSGDLFKAMFSVIRLPWNLVVATSAPRTSSQQTALPGWLVLALFVWVIGGFGAYLYRFQDLVVAALNMLGRL